MVQARKNWAQVTGRIVAVDDGDDPAGFSKLALSVNDVSDWEGFPNMLAALRGRTIEVSAPSDRVRQHALKAGDLMTAILSVVGPGRTVADPDSIARSGNY